MNWLKKLFPAPPFGPFVRLAHRTVRMRLASVNLIAVKHEAGNHSFGLMDKSIKARQLYADKTTRVPAKDLK